MPTHLPFTRTAWFVILLVWGCSSSLGLVWAAPNYFLRHWEAGNGLPSNNIRALTQTRDGYLWVGTSSGLTRFDGVRFTLFDNITTPEMQSQNVTALFESSGGDLWIGHETGELTRYRNGKFQEVKVKAAAAWRVGKILAIAEDAAGNIWLLNRHGELARVTDGLAITVPIETVKHLVSIAHNPKGGFWLRLDQDVFALEDERLQPLPLGGDPTNRFVQGICAAADGGVWVVMGNQIRKWRGNQWMNEWQPAPWGWEAFHFMIETKDGRVAAATSVSGMYLSVPNEWVLQFTHTNGLASEWVTSLTEDPEGNIWAGTANGGLVMLRPVNVTTVSPPNRWQGRAVLSVAAGPDNAVWVGTEGDSLYRFQNDNWVHFDRQVGILHRYIWSVTTDAEGRVWAGSWGGGVYIQNGNRFDQPPELKNSHVPVVTSLYRLKNGNMCLGTVNGLLLYETGKVTRLAQQPEIISPDVRVIAEGADGTIWFGMSGGGLGRYADGKLRQFRRADGLPSDFVRSLHMEADGTLWLGTSGSGLVRMQEGKFAAVTRKQGLIDDVICDIQDDGHGYFWISTHGGISRLSKADLKHAADDPKAMLAGVNYGISEGLPTLECLGGFQPASCRTEDGRLWFPTGKGLVIIDPQHTQTNLLAPPVVIEQMRVDGQIVSADQLAAGLRIPPGRHRLDIDYTGLSFMAPERVRFKYQLQGLDDQWISPGIIRSANYNYVPPGEYKFQVIACNNDGVWNETGATIAFTVLPFFWQTFWFRVIAGLLVLLGVGGAVWFGTRRQMHHKLERLERQRAIEMERSRIANDIHDDLGSHLTQITMLSETARTEVDDPIKARCGLTQIYDTARALTRAMDEIVWAVNPKHDTMEGLVIYLEKFTLDFLGLAGIRCRLEMPLQFPHWALTSEVRHNLFLAFKEAIHNVVKHAEAKEVCITLEFEPAAFTLVVEDNGKGFAVGPPNAETSTTGTDRFAAGNGLNNMRRRLARIGGRCLIQSVPQQGTKIIFRAPATMPPGKSNGAGGQASDIM